MGLGGLGLPRLHARRRGQIKDEAEGDGVVEDDVSRVLGQERITKVRLGPHGRGREALGERVERVVLVFVPIQPVEQLVEVQVEKDNDGVSRAQSLWGRLSRRETTRATCQERGE